MIYEEDPVVGRRFRSDGCVYLCTGYDSRYGYWMEMVERNDPVSFPSRNPGDRNNVSEQAIGRTYHRIRHDDSYVATHDQICDCRVCKPKEAGA